MVFPWEQIIQFLILSAMVLSAFLALKSRNLFASIAYLAAMSLMLAAEFYLLRAPDVAMAEAAVGAGLSSAIYLAAVYRLKQLKK
jgi:energy-converting hydrogenase B subunit D